MAVEHETLGRPVWQHNTPIKFWELTLSEQMIYASAFGAEFQYGHNKTNSVCLVANNALYSFWRKHGNPRYYFPSDKSFRFGDDDAGK